MSLTPEENRSFQAQLEAVLAQLPDDVHIVEYPINPEVMNAYQTLAAELAEAPEDEIVEATAAVTQLLELSQRDDFTGLNAEQEKTWQKSLVRYAESGEIQAFRALKQWVEQLDGLSGPLAEEWLAWHRVALLQCRMRLENQLSDQQIGYIATGLGGKGKCIRFYFAVKAQDPIEEAKVRFITQEYEDLAKEYEAEIESVRAGERYVLFGILMPYKKSLLGLIADGVEQSGFLDGNFYVTNLREPQEEDLAQWLAEPAEEEDIEEEEELEEEENDEDFD
jgi:hypothetical protein